MKKSFRYVIYFLIAVVIYQFIGKDEDSISQFRTVAPYLILGVFILVLLLRFIKPKE